jgi:spore coat protein U-like protein
LQQNTPIKQEIIYENTCDINYTMLYQQFQHVNKEININCCGHAFCKVLRAGAGPSVQPAVRIYAYSEAFITLYMDLRERERRGREGMRGRG